MGIQDLIITPIWFFLLLIGAILIRPLVTNSQTKKYFLPGLLVKFFGAICLGLVFQFYYGGGDTFTFHTQGSRWIWQAFMDNPIVGIQIFLSEAGEGYLQFFKYVSKIWMYRDQTSLFVIKVAAFFDIFTFATYSSTALFFASFAFSGQWALYMILQKLNPDQTKQLAIACLFIPSVIFWGSGILKDSITLSALCWMTFGILSIQRGKFRLFDILIIIFMGWIIYSIKIYILLSYLVAVSIFLYLRYFSFLRNNLLKLILTPILFVFFIGGGWFTMQKIAESDSRYALDKIAQTAMITAYDIRYGWGARNGENSGYTLGELDGTVGSFIALSPKGVIVTLFRPFPWESRNLLMALASIESFAILLITCYVIIRTKRKQLWSNLKTPIVTFFLVFSLIFAFAVGVSTYNFGTLMRYKIPVIPFYVCTLIFLNKKSNDVIYQ